MFRVCFSRLAYAIVMWSIASLIGVVVSIHGSWRLRRPQPQARRWPTNGTQLQRWSWVGNANQDYEIPGI